MKLSSVVQWLTAGDSSDIFEIFYNLFVYFLNTNTQLNLAHECTYCQRSGAEVAFISVLLAFCTYKIM